MPLSTQLKKRFRTIGHKLKPVVTVAENGVSDNVVTEINRALEDHELIKIKLVVMDREDKSVLTDEIIESTQAELVHTIGNVVLIYRAAEKQKEKLSNIVRYQHLSS